ncbi:hypothetical protein D3C86_2072700 [compost metagenome]
MGMASSLYGLAMVEGSSGKCRSMTAWASKSLAAWLSRTSRMTRSGSKSPTTTSTMLVGW